MLENGQGLQSAVMVLDSGEQSGPYANDHPESEQVLYVVEGIVEGEIGAPHRFVNRSMVKAVTFNVYAPKAY